MEKKNDLHFIPVTDLKGVGEKTAVFLKKRGIKTIEDLLWHLPVRYEDRRTIKNIIDLSEGEKATIVAEVLTAKKSLSRYSRKSSFVATVKDKTGTILLKWFYGSKQYLQNLCRKGNLLFISGQVSRYGRDLQIVHPDITVLDDEKEIDSHSNIITIYPEIEGIKQGVLRNLIRQAFEDYGSSIEGFIPLSLEEKYSLVTFKKAIIEIHLPPNDSSTNDPGIIQGQYMERLILEEYFLFQSALHLKKSMINSQKGISLKPDGELFMRFKRHLGFELTHAQVRVIEEIKKDMASDRPMNRLLQGDVGCGKTICAIFASCIAIDNGYQVAIMAPTEILAEQHYLTVHRAFEGMGINVAFLRGNMGREREAIIKGIGQGKISVIVGTHALIQSDVVFHRLGLVIIDEQHRFGVIQRKVLREKAGLKGEKTGIALIPHTLVMTATPIPRTLSMVIYGDLDVSIIDEMPKGKQRIQTEVFLEKDRDEVYRMVEEEIKQGRQAYIVYPLVEESDKIDLLNAKTMARHLQESVFPSFRIGLLHGRMTPEEKEETMLLFKNSRIDVLVCTTVIEVGIDCPNATIIVIEHAERFGLSQLHQLRGRVGRGRHPSRCILMASAKKTDLATKRLKVMEETTDGFIIAEEDMKIRGPGDMMGARQSGIPDFRIGNIVRDSAIMSRARAMA
ncbi:MAG: ATP-dependent DNA helicase RecG, partial [Syntrophorhabdaceae bacterium]|nr:ATP-dependent DNA helicase RecG [Syntrophorhabdaceae bacterium]